MKGLVLALCLCGWVSVDQVLAQVGCTLVIFPGTTSEKIHFVGTGVNWTELQSAASAWTGSCTDPSVIPTFAFQGQAGSVPDAHIVQVSEVHDGQMVNSGACAEANRDVLRINKDVS